MRSVSTQSMPASWPHWLARSSRGISLTRNARPSCSSLGVRRHERVARRRDAHRSEPDGVAGTGMIDRPCGIADPRHAANPLAHAVEIGPQREDLLSRGGDVDRELILRYLRLQVPRNGHRQCSQEEERQVEAGRELHLAVRACEALPLGF